MSLVVDLARLSAGLNVLLLLSIAYVWADSYRQIRSHHTLVTLLFAVFLLAENALALYYYLTSASLPAAAMQAMMTLSVLETVGWRFPPRHLGVAARAGLPPSMRSPSSASLTDPLRTNGVP